MSKPEQVLIIEPQNELKFKGPFNMPVTSYMKLTNPSDKQVLFKIKTTAPKKYCVRPNSGLLRAGATTEIAISLQPLEFGTDKSKHKFMVQSVFAPEGNYHIDQIWKDTAPDQLMDSKLKCVFEALPEESNAKEGFDETIEISAKSQNNTQPATTNDQTQIMNELKELKESDLQLRQENLRLKEEVLRLKMENRGSTNKKETINKYQPPASQDNMAVLIIVAVVLGILGMILGKFML